ncbi:MAG: hypothetical protein AAGD00_02600 [Planctomycetota bacterium]
MPVFFLILIVGPFVLGLLGAFVIELGVRLVTGQLPGYAKAYSTAVLSLFFLVGIGIGLWYLIGTEVAWNLFVLLKVVVHAIAQAVVLRWRLVSSWMDSVRVSLIASFVGILLVTACYDLSMMR